MFKKYLNTFLIIFVILLIITQYGIFAYFYINREVENTIVNEEIVDSFENTLVNEVPVSEFYVEIKGAVNNPGVYKVNDDNIINDVISLAGGLKSNAYTQNINLSKNVSKEMVIYIYTNYEYSLLSKPEEKTTECNCPKQDISVCTEQGISVITSDESKMEQVISEENVENDENENSKVNINTALKDQLTTLSGIGDAKAQNIIDYRNENGLFASIEDIKNVSGISEKLFEQIKEFITI